MMKYKLEDALVAVSRFTVPKLVTLDPSAKTGDARTFALAMGLFNRAVQLLIVGIYFIQLILFKAYNRASPYNRRLTTLFVGRVGRVGRRSARDARRDERREPPTPRPRTKKIITPPARARSRALALSCGASADSCRVCSADALVARASADSLSRLLRRRSRARSADSVASAP